MTHQLSQLTRHGGPSSTPDSVAGEKLISRREAAASLGVCGRTVLALEKRGLLPSVRFSARCVRYRMADVATLVNQALVGQPVTPEPRASASGA